MFKLNRYPFFIHISLVKLNWVEIIEELAFFLSMLIDNGTWHATVGILYSLKPLPKIKPKIKEMLAFLLHHTTYFLASILDYLVTTQLNHHKYIFNCIINKILTPQNLHLLKIANLILLSLFFFSKFTFSVWEYFWRAAIW